MKKSKCEQVVDKMLDLLSNGEYAPGDKLPPEVFFMERFDASRITIRESFKQLSMMGLINIKQGDGTYVTCAAPSKLASTLMPYIVLSGDNVNEMFEARRTIEVAMLDNVVITELIFRGKL